MRIKFSVKKETPVSKLFIAQSVGFLAIIALSWVNEWLGLTSLIFPADHPIADFHKSALEMLFALAIWFLVTGATRRLVRHVHYLEGFARVCGWCHHIHFKGEWMTIEDFLERGFDTPTTHGVCPKCLEREKAAIERALKAREHLVSGEDASVTAG